MQEHSSGVYTDLTSLIRLRHKARGFSFKPQQPLASLLAGRHSSRLRGRGLDFEEMRLYHSGDDIRTIDWKVSNRTGKAHVRIYGEEKERSVHLILDQRLNMFFGSVQNMKSVTAAEVLALGAWKVVDGGDRIGGLVFNDDEICEIKPQRSRKSVMHLLNEVVRLNQKLSVNCGIEENPNMLNNVLQRAASYKTHNRLYAVISDFSGLNESTTKIISSLTAHNDVILIPVFDPLAKALPDKNIHIRLSDGQQQMQLKINEKKITQKVPLLLQGRLKTLCDELTKFNVPVLPISTAQPTDEQLRSVFGSTQNFKTAVKPAGHQGVR